MKHPLKDVTALLLTALVAAAFARPAPALVEKLSRSRDTREFLLVNHRTGALAKAFAETDPAWVDMEHGGLEWIRGGKTFVVFSERDGWRRAYVVSRDGSSLKPITPAGSDLIARGQVDHRNGWFYYFAYPNRDHGLSEGKGTTVHVQMLITRYLIEHLPPGPR